MSKDQGFTDQIHATLAFEGGYVNDPNDSGGETNFGISKRSYPKLNIAELTVDDAIKIYKRDFWDKPKLARLPPTIGSKVFDLSVNMGGRQATRLLQRAINGVLGQATIDMDGIIGPATLEYANSIDPAKLLPALRAEAARFYQSIARNSPRKQSFLKGWLRRAAA